MRDLPGPGIELTSPALAGRLPATGPPGKFFIFRKLKNPKQKRTTIHILTTVNYHHLHHDLLLSGFPGGSVSKESTCSMGDLGLIPGLGGSPGGGHGNSLQYSCLKNPHGQRSLAGYSSRGRKELDMTEQLILYLFLFFLFFKLLCWLFWKNWEILCILLECLQSCRKMPLNTECFTKVQVIWCRGCDDFCVILMSPQLWVLTSIQHGLNTRILLIHETTFSCIYCQSPGLLDIL